MLLLVSVLTVDGVLRSLWVLPLEPVLEVEASLWLLGEDSLVAVLRSLWVLELLEVEAVDSVVRSL